MKEVNYSERLKKVVEMSESYMDKVKEATFWMSLYAVRAMDQLRRGVFTPDQAAQALENNTPQYANVAAPSSYGLYGIVRTYASAYRISFFLFAKRADVFLHCIVLYFGSFLTSF
jgi:hypothetical protein